MFKNIHNKNYFKNFIQNGFYIDFIIKKIVLLIFINILKTTIMFLEKNIIEFFPKNIKNILILNKNKNNYLNFFMYIFFLFVLNIFLICVFLI